MIEKLIEEYTEQLKDIDGSIEEIDEMYEDYNPSDWSGGNFDDAYELGKEHGETFTEKSLISKFIRQLAELTKE